MFIFFSSVLSSSGKFKNEQYVEYIDLANGSPVLGVTLILHSIKNI